MAEISIERVQLAKRLKAAREGAGVTADEAAKLTDVGKAAVYHWETGHSVPDLFKLKTLARRYGSTLEAIVSGANDWPFDRISQTKVRALQEDEMVQLQTAILLSAATLGLDVHESQPAKEHLRAGL